MLYLRLLVAALFASVRARRDLVLENLALRHQLAVYTRGRRRPRLRRHDRRLWSLLARGWSGWRGTLVMVEPDTVVRWHRSAWRAYWRWKSRRRSGRPRIPAELRQLIVRIATENPRWGAVRIVGELRALGFEVSARTVSRYRRASAPGTAEPVVAHVSAQPRVQHLGRRSVHGPDARLPHALRAHRDRPRPAPHPALERHGASERALDLAADDRGDRLGSAARVPHPRPRP